MASKWQKKFTWQKNDIANGYIFPISTFTIIEERASGPWLMIFQILMEKRKSMTIDNKLQQL